MPFGISRRCYIKRNPTLSTILRRNSNGDTLGQYVNSVLFSDFEEADLVLVQSVAVYNELIALCL